MKKLIAVAVAGIMLIGCGGSSDSSPAPDGAELIMEGVWHLDGTLYAKKCETLEENADALSAATGMEAGTWGYVCG